MAGKSALVLFSGGQDSTVCLAYALSRFDRVETIGFSYGQRHDVELECRQNVLSAFPETFPDWADKLGEDLVCDLPGLAQIGGSSLTGDVEFQVAESGLPNTFVPGRNLMFLTMAGALAWRRGINTIIGGMCETDYSGYPDCRRSTMNAQQLTLARGLDTPIVIDTPLMWLDKSETWELAEKLGGRELVDLIAEKTHTCYNGDRIHRHDWGYGCGTCPACKLRAAGWEEWSERAAA